MKTKILKQAKLTNTCVWKTTITWETILDCTGRTRIVVEQKYITQKDASYVREEIYENNDFDKAYDDFHKLLANWI